MKIAHLVRHPSFHCTLALSLSLRHEIDVLLLIVLLWSGVQHGKKHCKKASAKQTHQQRKVTT
jgi:hypothetical protein